MKGRAGRSGKSLWFVPLAAIAALLIGAVIVVVPLVYLVRRGADFRAPRLLPGGYTVARFTHEGADGTWGLSPPGDPLAFVRPVNADGSDDTTFWLLKRLAIAGDRLVVEGTWQPHNGKPSMFAFELDTRTKRVTMLEGVAEAERRVEQLRGEHRTDGPEWTDLESLPFAPAPQ